MQERHDRDVKLKYIAKAIGHTLAKLDLEAKVKVNYERDHRYMEDQLLVTLYFEQEVLHMVIPLLDEVMLKPLKNVASYTVASVLKQLREYIESDNEQQVHIQE